MDLQERSDECSWELRSSQTCAADPEEDWSECKGGSLDRGACCGFSDRIGSERAGQLVV